MIKDLSVVIATRNRGKLAEMQALLKDFPVSMRVRAATGLARG